jgi:CRP-like cAMP-binding protein
MTPSLPSRQLSYDFRQALQEITSVRVYPKGSTLFQHGMPVTGIYVVETGQVQVLLPTNHCRRQLLDLVGPGSVLGLSETLSGDNYRVTAEAGDQTTAAFVSRETLVEFLRQHSEYCVQVLRLLSEDLHRLYHKFRNISSHTPADLASRFQLKG